MKRFALVLPLAFATQALLAQAYVPVGLDAERNLAELGGSTNATMVSTYDNRYEGVKGTPFFHPEWSKATIAKNNTLFRNVDVKYNVYENVLMYRSADGKEFILTPSKVDSFTLTDNVTRQEQSFKKLPALASQDAKLANLFVLVFFEGKKTQLVMAPDKRLMKANFKGAYSTGNKYDEFIDNSSYYLVSSDNKVEKVKLNKKSLLKALPDKQDKVEEYISSNKVDVSTGTGWAKALAYYESL